MNLEVLDQCIYITYSKESKASEIHKLNGETVSYHMKPIKLLNHCLLSIGSSYEGRAESFKVVTNTRQKSCILISEISQMMFFPTLSPSSDDCVWIAKDYVLDYSAFVKGESTEVLFINGEKIVFQIDRRVIKEQFKRCDQYLKQISLNMKLMKSPNIHLNTLNAQEK